MAFDLRNRFPEDPLESQIAEGGRNAHSNCVTTSFLDAEQAYGQGDPYSPQQVTDGIQPGHIGGWDFHPVASWIQAHFPSGPSISVYDLADPNAAIQIVTKNEQQSQLCLLAFNIEPQTVQIVPYSTGWTHASVPVAYDGLRWTVWNVWTGFEQTFSDSDFRLAYAGSNGGQVAVFERSLIPFSGGSPFMFLLYDGTRLDFGHVGSDRHVYHRWDGLLDTNNEDWGTPFASSDPHQLVWVTGSLDDGGRTITIVGLGSDGSLWHMQRNKADGSIHNDWAPMPGAAAYLPVGPPGPVGAQGPPGIPGVPGPSGPADPALTAMVDQIKAAALAAGDALKGA